MAELTEEQKANAKKICDELIEYLWSKVEVKMKAGVPMEHAVIEIMREIQND